MRDRAKKRMKAAGMLLAAGFLYYIIVKKAGFFIPCPIRFWTGYLCPGCGITHMILALLEGDFYGAYQSNPGLMILTPWILALFLYSEATYIRYGHQPRQRWYHFLLILLIILLLLYGIVRNISL